MNLIFCVTEINTLVDKIASNGAMHNCLKRLDDTKQVEVQNVIFHLQTT